MKNILTLLAVTFVGSVLAQSDLTFYHMGAETPQSAMVNASYFPNAKVYVSLPILSGSQLNANLGASYNDLMTPIDGTDSVKIDLEKFISSIEPGDNLSLRGDFSLFQFGLSLGKRRFSLFSNLRFAAQMNYPVKFLDYFISGNGAFIGAEVEEENLKGGGIAYHEIGVGYAQDVSILGKKLTVGGRAKLLTGLAYAGTSKEASMTLYTDPTSYLVTARFNDAQVRTAGFNALQGEDAMSYLLGTGNDNKGFALDLGAQLEVNDKLGVNVAINDLGSIHWQQDVETYSLVNSEITLGGFDNIDTINLAQAVEDSIDVWTESVTSTGSFKKPIGTRMIIGATYRLLPNGTASGSLYRNGSSFAKGETGFGLGYTHKIGNILTVSTTFLKEQTRPVEMGLGFMFRAGFLQLYGSFDDVFNTFRETADVQGVSYRFGMNFVFGQQN